MIEKIQANIAPICRTRITRNEKILSKFVQQEYESIGKPRLDENLILDLENLAIQKMLIVKKYGLNEVINDLYGEKNENNL